MNTLPPLLALALPALTTPLTGWLSHNGFAPWANTAIALVAIIAATIAWAAFGQSLTGNVVADAMLLAAYMAALMAGPLRPLYAYTTLAWPSPLCSLLLLVRPAKRPLPSLIPRPSALPPQQLWRATPPDISELPTRAVPTAPLPKLPPSTPPSSS